jgi:hypothetical protein
VSLNAEASVRIERGAPDDAPRLVLAYEWLFAPPGSRPRGWDADRAADTLARVCASDDSAVLVAREGDEVVGICTVYLDIDSVRFGRPAGSRTS